MRYIKQAIIASIAVIGFAQLAFASTNQQAAATAAIDPLVVPAAVIADNTPPPVPTTPAPVDISKLTFASNASGVTAVISGQNIKVILPPGKTIDAYAGSLIIMGIDAQGKIQTAVQLTADKKWQSLSIPNGPAASTLPDVLPVVASQATPPQPSLPAIPAATK